MNILTSSALTVEVILGDQTFRVFTSDRNSSTLENSPLPIPEANAENPHKDVEIKNHISI